MTKTEADRLEETAASQRALDVSNLDRDFNHLRNARAALRRTQRQLLCMPGV
jgi:hypothetical protein